MAEQRITNEATGGEKGSKGERYDLIPVGPLAELARLYGRGSRKYSARNWERGYDWSLSYAALQRHANAWWGGEEIDDETGLSHMAAVAWHAFALMEFAVEHRDLDDRPRVHPAAEHNAPEGGAEVYALGVEDPVILADPGEIPCAEPKELRNRSASNAPVNKHKEGH